MKSGTLIVCSVLLLFSCKKTKIEGELEPLQGKWQWVGSIELMQIKSTGELSNTYREASEFDDQYFLEIERKGFLSYFKNADEELRYRMVLGLMNDDCDYFEGCKNAGFYLNNDEQVRFVVGFTMDSMAIGGLHSNLPLKGYATNAVSYSYSHLFVRIN